jgi:endo-1,4-beta-xylanase
VFDFGDIDNRPALKDVFKDDFIVGVALTRDQIDGLEPKAVSIVLRHFGSIVPENVLKWEAVHPRPGGYDFDAADRFVAFGEQHGMHIVGHTLVWYRQTPDWVFEDGSGKRLGRKALLERMRDHIFTVMGRYRGRIHGWDVVNEALLDGGFRKCPWLDIIGEDYIQKAYEFAREADPDAELYYNDYNVWKPAQTEGVIRLVRDLRSDGVHIDALGIQGHWGMEYPDQDEIETFIEALLTLDIPLMFTEVDLSVLPYDVDNENVRLEDLDEATRARINRFKDGLPEEAEEDLATRWSELFWFFRHYRENIRRVTLWGVHDGQSWRNDTPVVGRTDYPTLFNRELEPRPAFDAVVDIGLGKE